MQRARKLASEFAVSHRLWGDAVNRARQCGSHYRVAKDTYDVFDVNPREPLFSAAERSAQSEFERNQQLLKRAALVTQNNAGANVNYPNAQLDGAGRFTLPFLTDLAHESVSGGRRFFELFVAAITVEPDRRAADKNRRLAIK